MNLPDHVVDDDGVRGQEEVGEALRDLRELQPRAVENLWRRVETNTKTHFLQGVLIIMANTLIGR